MKILIINHFPLRGSGSGTYVRDIAKGFVEKGNEVCLIFPENTIEIQNINNVKMHPVFFKRNETIKDSLEFNFPCMDPHPRSNFLFDQMTEEQIQQYDKAFSDAIEKEILEFKPDVIHSQHIWIISGILKKYDIPYVITSHGAEFITYRKTDTFDSYGFDAVDACKKIVAISKENIKEIIEKFPKAKDKIEFIKNGYNSKQFYIEKLDKKEVLKKFGIDKEYEKIVLFVGRVSKLKGLDTLFNAAQIYEDEKTLTLIAGDGDFKDELQIMKEKLNLKNIVFLGNREHDELRELYNIANVFVLPSRKEALPLVALESLACGTPAIVTNLYGMDEIITKEVGLIFEMDNEKMLAEKINLILNKEIEFDGEDISNYANENYSQETLISKLLELYESIKK